MAAGIRYQDRLDLGLIACDRPAAAAGVFTTNQVQAAPVLLGRQRLAATGGRCQAVLVNAGIANACTGEQGMSAAAATGRLAAAALGIDEELVQVASTGVIGEPLPEEPFARAMPALVDRLAPERLAEVAQAILTTDTRPKVARRACTLSGRPVVVAGMAKGAGMIMPNMATMLAFILTDAAVAPDRLQQMLAAAVDGTFNAITVDGDTSTNDTVLLLASGMADHAPLTDDAGPAAQDFSRALTEVCRDLALAIVADGEGASKCVAIKVVGAPDRRAADRVARTVANSPLVKTAFFGEDANWGRILGAAGRAGVRFDPQRVAVFFDGVQMVAAGRGCGSGAESRATEVLRRPRFTVTIDLGAGPATATVYTCDLSIDYVKINADYRT
ncbi:MAG TPA: bifunctional glutamate N-acetyltransferase/amino-acid acetyltransferase ArgJ [Desulfobacterales bacterium]|nr:bifunctional glutamate N-acetyltransferase/amino-acid acetyltransferase ArgJ [Desulfobacterales bacterium]